MCVSALRECGYVCECVCVIVSTRPECGCMCECVHLQVYSVSVGGCVFVSGCVCELTA